MSWIPLRRRGQDPAAYEGPFEGVTEWLSGPLWTWCVEQIPLGSLRGYDPGTVEAYRRLAMALRFSLEDPGVPNPINAHGMRHALLEKVSADPELLFDIADYFISLDTLNYYGRSHKGLELEAILEAAGSAWTVLHGAPPSLIRRVSEQEQKTAQALVDTAGRPGVILTAAWTAAYGRDPNPSTAYREAVRAVEAAAVPVVSPNNARATLGTLIADLRAKPEKWHVEFGAGLSDPDRVSTIASMMDLLWKGQHDRHGTPREDAPLNVSQHEAEAAVHMGMLLVRWFTDRSVVPVGQD